MAQDLSAASGNQDKHEAGPRSEVYNAAFCRACRLYKCQSHRRRPITCLKRPAIFDESEDCTICGNDCWHAKGTQVIVKDVTLQDTAYTLGTASSLERQVQALQQASEGDGKLGGGYHSPRPVSRRKRPSHRTGQAKKVIQRRAAHKEPLWEAYMPCQCQGGCGDDCPCLNTDNFCLKFCACSAGCNHYTPGCMCTGSCRTKICPCIAAGFECDPDVCMGCRCAILDGKPAGGKEKCQNMKLRLRQHKRVAVGLSSIAGWGAFLMMDSRKSFLQEPALRNELIGEYTGELVDQREAERRGKVYDRDDNSYLFNLNMSWVIDARMRGNKLRFANHSTDPNCSAKILVIDGDHRVGIFALKDIKAGEELLYNYLYTQEQAPDWAKAV